MNCDTCKCTETIWWGVEKLLKPCSRKRFFVVHIISEMREVSAIGFSQTASAPTQSPRRWLLFWMGWIRVSKLKESTLSVTIQYWWQEVILSISANPNFYLPGCKNLISIIGLTMDYLAHSGANAQDLYFKRPLCTFCSRFLRASLASRQISYDGVLPNFVLPQDYNFEGVCPILRLVYPFCLSLFWWGGVKGIS